MDRAAAVDLGVKFLSARLRGRFHPRDGFLYASARAAGRPLPVPRWLPAARALYGPAAALPRWPRRLHRWHPASTSPSRWALPQPTRKRFADLREPFVDGQLRIEELAWSVGLDREGKDAFPVEAVTPSDDGRSLFSVYRAGPVVQMHAT
ncbi:MAG: hypothetical protein U0840_27410 [Gemmataceae bacterium]